MVILPVELFPKLPLFVMTVDVPEIERLVPFKAKFPTPLTVKAPPEIERLVPFKAKFPYELTVIAPPEMVIFATLLANNP